jgi:membrane protease YdiL (CAAX protease family)
LKIILDYIRNYLQHSDKKIIFISSFFCAVLIFLNYHFQLDQGIGKNSSPGIKLLLRAGVFMVALGIPVFIQRRLNPAYRPLPYSFYFFLLFAVFLFAFKYNFRFHFSIDADPVVNTIWNKMLYWPFLLLIMALSLFIVWKWFIKEDTAWGILTPSPGWRPYLIMLLLMLPLVALAATQPDFQAVYPKLKLLSSTGQLSDIPWWQALLFELSYGSDFLSIELFFRGFLILGLSRWLGKDAILPVAIFYCSIHFGKPLGECISSYFGGMLLGIVVYNTRSIWGGLLVHLGIAWMMEVAGEVISR